MAPRPKRPAKTAEEKALERRQQIALDKEIEETEEKLGLFKRRTLGARSLLSGAARTTAEAAGAPRAAGGGGQVSLLGGSGVRTGANVNRSQSLMSKK